MPSKTNAREMGDNPEKSVTKNTYKFSPQNGPNSLPNHRKLRSKCSLNGGLKWITITD